jgi:CzcA family heavy metal efflux pump
MNPIPFAHRHRRALVFGIALLVLAGVAAAFRLPVALFPSITFPRIVILADNGEQPIERMLIEVTRPLEEAARGVPGVTVVRSTTSRGSTEISVSLRWGSDIDRALQRLDGAIAAAGSELPSSVAIRAERMDVSVFPILGFSLTSAHRSAAELRELAMYTIRPALLRIDGVGRVEVTGGAPREIQVIPDAAALTAHRLDVHDVSEAIAAANLNGAVGLVTDDFRLYLAVTDNVLPDLQAVREVVVVSRDGVPVRVGDVAEVGTGEEDVQTRITSDGRPAVLLDITRQPDGNTVQIGRDTRRALAELSGRIPADVRIAAYMDQSEFIDDSIHGARDAIVLGVVLAMGVLLVFLRNLRITLVAGIIVPATIAATIGCLYVCRQTINIMTLGGIAAAVGLVIDDVIVVVESIFHHFHAGSDRFIDTASAAIAELFPAILGSSLATLVIHIPFAFLGGVAGAFFAALSLTMVFALSISFLFSVVLAPLVASWLMTQRDVAAAVERERARTPQGPGGYERALRQLLQRPWIVVPALGILLAGAALLYGRVGTGFMPDMDEGTFVLDYKTPPGTSFDETSRMLRSVEAVLRATPEVENYGRRTGTQLGFFITEPNDGDILVKLRAQRRRSIFEVIDSIRSQIETVQPALEIEFGQQMQDVIGDLTNNPSPVEIKVFGPDPGQIQAVARQVAARITPIRGVEDVYDGITISGPSLAMHVDPLRAARASLTVRDVQDQLETMLRGSAETRIQNGERLMGIRTRFAAAARNDLAAIRRLPIQTPGGEPVPLEHLAAIRTTRGQAEIDRENLASVVSVTARIAGRDLGSTITEIQHTLRKELVLPRGVSLVYGGTYQTQQESFRGLAMVLGLAVVFVFLVLLFEFESFRVPLAVFLINLPSLFGVVAALWLTHVTFNLSSFVGAILVVGIVAENAIFLLHYVVRYQRAGMPLDEALVSACRVRMRPILMTTFAAVFALLPLAIGLGGGTQMQQPLAIAVIGGFSVSTLLLLFALPMLFGLLHRQSSRAVA